MWQTTRSFISLGLCVHFIGCVSGQTSGTSSMAMSEQTEMEDMGPSLDMPQPTRTTMPATPDAVVDPFMPPIDNPFGERPSTQSCIIPPAPPVGTFELTPKYPGVQFDRPLWFGYAPGEPNVAYVVEQGSRNQRLGRIISIRDDGAPTTFYERTVYRNNNEEGLLGLAFHPEFKTNHKFYIYYSAGTPSRRSVIAEVQRDSENPSQALPGSERILLEIPQPYGNHNGGDIRFGPDGYLYISVGDGGAAGDPLRSGQDISTLLGAILRIDVDSDDPLCSTPYAIPPDNPFSQSGCATGGEAMGRPEIWAWGLRNVWRMSFDRTTGALYAADVGQDVWEEVNVIEGGQNYGWRATEGNDCYEANCEPSLYQAPIHAYDHSEGDKSITGGFVYRGSQFPELWGQYIFGDFESGRIWALDTNRLDDQRTLLVDSNESLASFGEDAEGEIYAVSFERGILGFSAQARAAVLPPIPKTLSETGCFTNTATHTPESTVIPYEVRVPFWSDGLHKRRFFALPPQKKMTFRPDAPFDMPVGTVILKTIYQHRSDGVEHRVETRIIRKDERGWNGYTYQWREDQSDADLVLGRREVTLTTDGNSQIWEIPSRSDCDQCHVARVGYSLGLSTRQLNRQVTINGYEYAQLDAFAAGGFIDLPVGSEALPQMPDLEDDTAPIELRARAMLDTNCAMCHQPDGPADAEIDLRFTTPLADTKICGEEPLRGDLNRPGDSLLAPGQPENSILSHRMILRGKKQMPPLASRMVDTQGVEILRTWISSLSACP